MTVPSPLGRSELPALFARTCALLARDRGCELLLCDVVDVDADAVAIDALARLALAARRSGCEVRLRDASPELLGLVELIGLGDVLRSEEVVVGRPRLAGGDAAAIAGLAVARRGLPAPGPGGPAGV
jgi:ABC-type transporter Mla MlaB component